MIGSIAAGMEGQQMSESDTPRDGFLSTNAEIHSFAIGLYDGMKDWRARPRELPDNPDVQSEPHYYKGAYVIGTLLYAGLALLLLLTVLP